MNLKDHLIYTGGAGKEIHIFLDQYFRIYGIDHRVVLHHKLGIQYIAEKFGPDTIPIAENHIRMDWNGELPEDHNDDRFYRLAWACDDKLFKEAKQFADKLFKEK